MIRITAGVIILCLVISFVGCSGRSGSGDDHTHQPPEGYQIFEIGPDDVVMEYSIYRFYYNVEELLEDYDLVVIGTVTEELGVRPTRSEGYPAPVTEYAIRVEQLFYDRYDTVSIGSEVVVLNSGGKYDGVNYVHPSYPPYYEGQQVILFLKYTETGIFVCFPQGRYTVLDYHVYTVFLHSPRASLIIKKYHNMPLDDFLAEVEDAVETAQQREQNRLGHYDVEMQLDWDVANSLEDLVESVDLIFLGKVGEVLNVRDSAVNTPGNVSAPATSYSLTLTSSPISRRYPEPVLFNRHDREIGDTIVIVNPGGDYKGSRYVFPGSPPFSEGESVLLFLQESDVEGEYVVHPQGRFTRTGIRIQLNRHMHPQTGEPLPRIHPIFVEPFVDEILEAVEALSHSDN